MLPQLRLAVTEKHPFQRHLGKAELGCLQVLKRFEFERLNPLTLKVAYKRRWLYLDKPPPQRTTSFLLGSSGIFVVVA